MQPLKLAHGRALIIMSFASLLRFPWLISQQVLKATLIFRCVSF